MKNLILKTYIFIKLIYNTPCPIFEETKNLSNKTQVKTLLNYRVSHNIGHP